MEPAMTDTLGGSPVILGINAYHGDAAAALLIDGTCVAAVAEERFTRAKHQAGFPAQAIRWCLQEAGIAPEDLDHVAISRNPSAHLHQKALYAVTRFPSLAGMLRQRLANAARILDVKDALAQALDCDPSRLGARFHRVEHHRAHLASAMFCSPFENASCLSVDGMGDFVSTMWGRGAGNRIVVDGHVGYPHSLGIFYSAFTQFLGLPSYGDEYKLMGLAAYGEPLLLPQVREVLGLRDLSPVLNLDYFRHHVDGVDMTWDTGTPVLGPLWSPRMEEVFGPPRTRGGEVTDRDRMLAASVQARFEEVLFEMLRRLFIRHRATRLVMAGGVALNCLANGKISRATPFEQVWVQPAATDDGTAIGAALWVWHQVLRRPRSWVMTDAALGPEFSESECIGAIEATGLGYRRLPDGELADHVAARIAEGAIVGWFQGRMEFGPRALGNRSIVCDARSGQMKDILNSRIKHREPFRPFAPSVLAERTGEWFDQDAPSPFMAMAYQVLPACRARIPAVTHEDGTARLQTVEAKVSPRYHGLISAFERRTGVPVVLNTSFNENEPICCTPAEAVDTFRRTRMDLLVLGNLVVEGPRQVAAESSLSAAGVPAP
jgi:carbamoyltransferase